MEPNQKTWAEFIGYQPDPDYEPIPMFNICGTHPRRGSTVDANTLVREGIPIRAFIAPPLKEWKNDGS